MTAIRSFRRSAIALFVRQPKAVPHAPDGLDQGRGVPFELLPQVADVGLDDVSLAAEVVVPHVVQDLRLAEDARSVGQEVSKELVLGGREVDRLAGPPYLV